jgi:phage shock protein A
VALLERMKDKVTEEESLAQAYGELGEMGGDVDRELDEALEGAGSSKAAESLAALKAKMGIEA